MTPMRSVRLRIIPAMTSGDGLQPFSAPWCSSRVQAMKPCSSPYEAMSRAAWYIPDIVAGSIPGSTQLNRIMDIATDVFPPVGGPDSAAPSVPGAAAAVHGDGPIRSRRMEIDA